MMMMMMMICQSSVVFMKHKSLVIFSFFSFLPSFFFSGESLVYGFDDLTGGLQLSHRLVLSSKDYPGILLFSCQC